MHYYITTKQWGQSLSKTAFELLSKIVVTNYIPTFFHQDVKAKFKEILMKQKLVKKKDQRKLPEKMSSKL